MDDSSLLDGLRVWLDELGATEDQLAWVRDARLEERQHAPPEILLSGQATAAEAEELTNRVDSEPTLGGHVDSARFTPIGEAGTVGVFALRRL